MVNFCDSFIASQTLEMLVAQAFKVIKFVVLIKIGYEMEIYQYFDTFFVDNFKNICSITINNLFDLFNVSYYNQGPPLIHSCTKQKAVWSNYK